MRDENACVTKMCNEMWRDMRGRRGGATGPFSSLLELEKMPQVDYWVGFVCCGVRVFGYGSMRMGCMNER